MLQLEYSPLTTFQPELEPAYDVVVIGGGPSGATAATLLSMAGHRVVLVERSGVPRFHIGESLIPETYWSLKRIGMIPRMRAANFPKKYSVQFFSNGSKPSAPFYFDEYFPHECSITWQVERAEFDRMLLENAREKGVTVRSDAHVLDLLYDGERAVGVRVRLGTPGSDQGSAGTVEIQARVVVDATGQTAFLSNRLGLKRPDARLRKGTVWTYYKNARRDRGIDEGATLILQTEGKQSWFWFIPLQNNITSIGCTGNMHYMFSGGLSPEKIFQREAERCPALKSRLENATCHTEFLTTKDFSYTSSRGAGPGWVIIGDALGFIDPVYSTGVFLAFKSAEFAADAIDVALRNRDFSAQQLGSWQAKHTAGIDLFRKLVYAFYTPEFSFGEFFRAYPRFKNHMVDMLIGNIYRPGVEEFFEVMGQQLPPLDTPAGLSN